MMRMCHTTVVFKGHFGQLPVVTAQNKPQMNLKAEVSPGNAESANDDANKVVANSKSGVDALGDRAGKNMERL